MTRISLQTEIDILNRKNTESKKNKAELIQQKQHLQEDAENTLIAQGAEPDPAEPTLIDPVPDNTSPKTVKQTKKLQ